MATTGNYDQDYLTAEQQAEIQKYKDQWAAANAANDTDGMAAAHAAAEQIRNSAGYTGGDDGGSYSLLSGNNTQTGVAAGPGTGTVAATEGSPSIAGLTADQMQQWVDDYYYTNYNASKGWTNGYSVAMNQRSIANQIRQQMQANSNAWASADAATQQYLHDQNVKLAQLLSDSVGGAESTYNEQLGRWETANANLGYGYNTGQYNDLDFYRDVYGMTDEQIEQYRNDTDRYRNYVDQRVVRNWFDESNGYTGIYSQFVNGPYGQLLSGTNGVRDDVYMDLQGDGFADMSYADMLQQYQEYGAQLPLLKDNNNISDYTKQFTSYVDENGIIQPGQLSLSHRGGGISGAVGDGSYSGVSTPLSSNHLNTEKYAQTLQDARDRYYEHSHFAPDDKDPNATYINMATGEVISGGNDASSGGSGAGGTGGSLVDASGNINWPTLEEAGSLEEYLKLMYAASTQAQTLALQQAYEKNLAELAAAEEKAAAAYDAQKRQTDGKAAQQAANWREVANAMGLNSGAFGQGALAQNNQLQSDLTTLGTAQAQSQAELEQQRVLLGQEYQNAILKAQADNNMDLAYALYQEAVRQDEALRQQQQFEASLAADMTSQLLSLAKSTAGSSGLTRSYSGGYGGGDGDEPTLSDDYVGGSLDTLGSNYYALVDVIRDPSYNYTDKLAMIIDNKKLNQYERDQLMDELTGYTPA